MLRPIVPNHEAVSGISSPRSMIVEKGEAGDARLYGSADFRENTISVTGYQVQSDGPMNSKITFLKQQLEELNEDIARGTKDKKVSSEDLRRIIEQKTQTEKTLGLMEKKAVKDVVKKRDSMDHNSVSSDDCASTKDNSEQRSNEPLRLFSMPRKEYSIDDMGTLEPLRGWKEKRLARTSTMGPGINEESGSFHASDYLFLSSDSIRSPSCRSFAVTSRTSFRSHPKGKSHVQEKFEESRKSATHENSHLAMKCTESDQSKAANKRKHGRRSSITATMTGIFGRLSDEVTPQSASDVGSSADNKYTGMAEMAKERTYSIG